MDSAPPPPAILETLRTVEFRLGLKGYNVDEVDEYLEKAAVEAESLYEQLRQASDRLRQANEKLAQAEGERRDLPPPPPAAAPAAEVVPDETLQRTLLLAQRFVDQTKRESEAEAAEIVASAEERARQTVSQAEEQARQLSSDTERRLRDEVQRLEAMRAQLANDVENMARHLESERNRLRSTLSDVLKWVDENIQPAAALMALQPRGGEGARPAPRAEGRPARPNPPTSANGGEVAAAPRERGEVGQVLDLRQPAAPADNGPPTAHPG
ncbi:MAG TPA: DivIVA domain-containing protein [Acidimicrobiales bacterium]|nr:DivIVA domain-containing protein [Acidimicrobiales bacterium]